MLLIAPSINALFFTGILLLCIFVLFFRHFHQFMKLNYYQKIAILSLFVLAVGVHGLLHLGAEYVYGFNPYRWPFFSS